VCVRDDSQLMALMERDGLLGRSRPGTLFVIHSTVTPQLCRRFADSSGRAGTRLIDAPVSGLPERARNGTLTAFVGGADADVQEAWSGLSTMASRILHTGGVGSGQTTKILNNLVSLSTVAAVAEALRLAADLGLDTAAVRHALESASADSFTLRHWDFFEGEWLSGGREAAAELVAKDLHLANTLNAIRPPLMADAATRALRRHLGL
jgi:3-hydroxyisobutyrate dehydrogenase